MISNEGGRARSFHSGFIPHRRGDRPVAPTPHVGRKFFSFGSHLQRDECAAWEVPFFLVQSPFIWESSPTSPRPCAKPRSRSGCSLPSFGSHLQRTSARPRRCSRCSLPSFGSHLQRAAIAVALSWLYCGAVSLHLGVISNTGCYRQPRETSSPVQSPFIWESSPTIGNADPPTPDRFGAVSLHLGVISNRMIRCKQYADGAVSLHLGVISNLRTSDNVVLVSGGVQSPFIWESSPTSRRTCNPCGFTVRCSLPSFGSHLQREPHNPLICKDFVPPFATASSWLPSVLSEIS